MKCAVCDKAAARAWFTRPSEHELGYGALGKSYSYLCLCSFVSFLLLVPLRCHTHTITPGSLGVSRKARSSSIVDPLFSLKVGDNDISTRKPVHGGKPLTGVLPLRLLAAGDVLLSFSVSPPFFYRTQPAGVRVLIAVCSFACFLSHEILDEYRLNVETVTCHLTIM